MDAMRSTLMLLGVVLHAAQIYNPDHVWKVVSSERAVFFSELSQVIHLFRMPAFFIVSGFFCLMTVVKYGEPVFIKLRSKRIIIPLVSTVLLINSVQEYLLGNFTLQRFFLGSGWVSHLWFLINLCWYFLFTVLLVWVARQLPFFKGMFAISASEILSRRWLILLLPMYDFFVIGLGKVIPIYSISLGGITLFSFLIYLQYFLFGLFLYRNKNMQCIFASFQWLYLFLLVSACVSLAIVPKLFSGLGLEVVEVYLQGLITWLSCQFCFCFFSKLFNRQSRVFFYLSDASYSIYLFHHLIVIYLGLWVVQLELNMYFGFSLIVACAMLLSLCIHHFLILRLPLLRLLFNGK
ncbi:acyltransferase family protein [Zooshikella marina]|uniref:acyltransferase family protein n=1 Tax=Zooshikella ganghwensis TaxID=202772 RepID=UPI001BAFF073|nr:acyltransferase family protein [Zooshikella ganghwensis]MBU2707635.1 acyltransferase family protein [Zooshikella ganghwensis]